MADELDTYSAPNGQTDDLIPYSPPNLQADKSRPVAPAYDTSIPMPNEIIPAIKGEDYTGNRPRVGEALNLPEPSMSMYDDLQGAKDEVRLARERYTLYATHPEASRGALGEVIYRGAVVPAPKDSEADTSWTEYPRGIARNVAKNVTETVLAAGDWMESKVPLGGVQLFDQDGNFAPKYLNPEEYKETQRRGESATQWVSKNMGELKAGSGIVDNITLEGGQLVAGGGAGLKLANAGLSLIPRVANTKFIGGIAKVLGFEVGAASALSDDVQTLLVGDKAMAKSLHQYMPLLKGIEVDPNSPEYQQILGRRMNVLMDAVMLAKPAESVMKGVVWANSFFYSSLIAPVLQMGSKSKMEESIVREILDNLAYVGTKDDKASMEAKDRIIGLIKQNQDVFIKSEDEVMGDIKFATDTMTALERALQDNNTEQARQIIAQARSMRAGTLSSRGGAPMLSDKMGNTGREFEDATRRVEQGAGGSQGIEGARAGIVESGQRTVDNAQATVDSLGFSLTNAETAIQQLLKNDPTFGAKIDQLSRASGIEIYAGRNQASESIVANVRKAYEVMTAEKDRLFGAIKGGDVDPQEMITILTQLQPGQLDAAAGALPANTQFGALLDVVKKRMKEVAGEGGETVTRRETDEELTKRVTDWMKKNKVDFGMLYREIRPTISATADNLYNAAQPEAKAAGNVLRQFTQWIDGPALDRVANSGAPEAAQAARTAKNYFVTQYAPFWRDGVLGEVADIHRATVGRTSDAMRSEFGREIQPINFTSQTRTRLESVLNDANREMGRQVIDLLGRPEAGGNARLVTDYVIGDVTGGVAAKIKSGTPLDQMELNDIVGRLTNYGALIQRNFPEEAGRISNFIENLRSAKNDVAATRNALNLAEQAAKEARDRIYDVELNAFFKRQGVPNPNGYAIFEGLFNNRQNADTFTSLVERAKIENNPLIIEGMQAAYARYVREKFLGAGVELGGNRSFSVARERASQEEVSNILDYGRILFQDRPGVIQATEQLMELAGIVTRSKQAKAIASDSATAIRTSGKEATDKLITYTFGVLNRVGARLRAGTNSIINRLAPDEAAFRILDAVYSDPKYFLEIAERVQKADRRMSPETRDMIFAFMVRSGIYNEEDRQDFLPAMAQVELDARKNTNFLREQMNSVFFGADNPSP